VTNAAVAPVQKRLNRPNQSKWHRQTLKRSRLKKLRLKQLKW
jgi:hypothetical protein